MSVVHHFIRHASVEGLQSFLFHQNLPVESVDWAQNRPAVDQTVIQLLDRVPEEQQIRLRLDAERIKVMSDELGQAALMVTVPDPEALRGFARAIERSHYAFVHHPESFRRAEDVRYADHYRRGRDWSAYELDAEPTFSLPMPVSRLDAFRQAVMEGPLVGDRAHVDMFLRQARENESDPVYQITVFQEGLPDSVLTFDDNHAIVSEIRHPVTEFVLLYRPLVGELEVVAARQARRDMLARAFTETFLQQSFDGRRAALRRFDLEPLMMPSVFDWDLNDSIASVQLAAITFVDVTSRIKLALTLPPGSTETLFDYARRQFGSASPFTCGQYRPHRAKLRVVFEREPGARRGRVLTVSLSAPNGCDLRNRTEREQLIGEKYLKRWGLLRELV